jgi:hypothetical protein
MAGHHPSSSKFPRAEGDLPPERSTAHVGISLVPEPDLEENMAEQRLWPVASPDRLLGPSPVGHR